MAREASATVKMEEQGRVYIPAQTRKALGIYGETAHLDLDVRVIENANDTTKKDAAEAD